MNFLKIGIFICLNFGLVLSYQNEVTKFCRDNGLNFVSFWRDNKSPKVTKYLLKSSFENNLRSRFVENLSPFTFLSTNNIDTLIFISNNLQHVLETIHKHKIQKSILVVGKNGIEYFKNFAEKFAKNCFFYLLHYDLPNLPAWYTVMILNNSSQFIMNKIEFDKDGRIIEDYDLHGIELVGTTLSFMPYTSYTKCDDKGRNCDAFGLFADLIDMWSQEYNFTWDIFTGYGNDWGMVPKSGKNWSNTIIISKC